MQNLFHQAIIAAEVMGILVDLVILYGNIFENKRRARYVRYFSHMVLLDIVVLGADVLSYYREGEPGWESLILISTTVAVVGAFLLVAEFAVYLYAYICEKQKVRMRWFRVFLILNAICAVALLVGCASGKVFAVENSRYVEGELYPLYLIANGVFLILSLVLVTIYRKILGKHDAYAAYFYVGMPALSVIISLFVEDWSFSFPASSLSLLILYVMIQTERHRKLNAEKDETLDIALHDSLTGVRNRLAYTKRLEELEQKRDCCLGVVFTDVNGLKYVNDHFGHKQGDELLKNYAELLREVFEDENIYRISGDEFVMLLPDCHKKLLDDRVHELKNALRKDDVPMACVGSQFGYGPQAEQLVMLAEEEMYHRKQDFYRAFPLYKR